MTLPSTVSIFAADVGKPKNLGWARSFGESRSVGQGAGELADALALDAKSGLSIAVGFECPLFLPIAKEPQGLLLCRSGGRSGDGDRSWSAGAAPAATTAGMVTMTWILRKLAQSLGDSPTPFSNWDTFCKSSGSHRVFVWEAFISKRKGKLSDVLGDPPTNTEWEIKDAYHIHSDKADALTAVDAFVEDIGKPTDVDVAPGFDVLSLIHSVIAWLDWSVENVPIHVASIVRKRNKPNWDAVPRQ